MAALISKVSFIFKNDIGVSEMSGPVIYRLSHIVDKIHPLFPKFFSQEILVLNHNFSVSSGGGNMGRWRN